MLTCTAWIALTATPRLAGEYQTLVETSAPRFYYELKPNHNYVKGELHMVNGQTIRGNVTEAGIWEGEVSSIHFTYTNEDGKKANYNTISAIYSSYGNQVNRWVMTALDNDQSMSTYIQTSYYE
jgi:hypothetical protein